MLKKITEYYKKIPLSLKASVWFVICGVCKEITDIAVTPVFTRILTTEEYGVYNVYNSWFQIFKILFTLYLFSDVFSVGLVRFENKRDSFVSATLGFITTITGMFLILYFIQHHLWEQILDLPDYMILMLFAQSLSYVPFYCWIRRERFDYHYRAVAAVSLLYVFLQPVLGIAAICCTDIPINPGYTRIIAAVLVQFVIGMILYAGMMRRGRIFFHPDFWKYSLKTGVVLIPYNLSKIVLNQSDRIMINHFSGKADTGIYSVAHSAAFVINVVMDGLNGAFVPWLYKKLREKDFTGIVPIVNVLVFLASCGVFFISVIAPEVMKILADTDYQEGIYCIPSLACSVYFIFIYTLFSDIELFYEKNGYVTIASAAGSVINILLNAVFIPVCGFTAAGYTTLASYIVMSLGHYFFMRKCLRKVNVEIEKIFNLKVLLIISAGLLLFSITCVALYEWVVIRAALLAVPVTLLLFFRHRWTEVYRELKG